jgi:ribonucleoside-diphosphate reductase alpha chain
MRHQLMQMVLFKTFQRFQNIKELYKTAWEISQRSIIEHGCRSWSLHLSIAVDEYFHSESNMAKLTSMHFYGWEKGLKTGMYYLRTKAAADAIKFTLPTEIAKQSTGTSTPVNTVKTIEQQQAAIACSLENPDSCEMCSG